MLKPFQSMMISLVILLSLMFMLNIQFFVAENESYVKTALVAESLRIGFLDRRLPDYRQLLDNPCIYVSSENIENVKLPVITGLNFVKVTPEQLQIRADESGDFMYVYFSKIELSPTPYVEVMSKFQLAHNSTDMYLAGGLMGIEFSYGENGWNGKLVKWLIS